MGKIAAIIVLGVVTAFIAASWLTPLGPAGDLMVETEARAEKQQAEKPTIYGERPYPNLLPTPTTRENYFARDNLYNTLDSIAKYLELSPAEPKR